MDATPRLRIFRPIDDAPAEEQGMGPHERSALAPDARGSAKNEMPSPATSHQDVAQSQLLRCLLPATCTLLLLAMTGCSAFRPLKGVPVRKLPWELRAAESRAGMETIDLSRLGQTPLPAHLVDSRDILAIYVEGILGRLEEAPPVHMPQNSDTNASFGYPIPVREDGTISLPLVEPLRVRGLTIAQVEDLVRRAYTVDRQILEKGRERILVSLMRARTHKITVLRQETSNVPLVSVASTGSVQLGNSKQGTGQIVELQAGENDVLHALTLTGGLPGLDAQNAIYVLRRPRADEFTRQSVVQRQSTYEAASQVVTAPIQLTSGQTNPYRGRYSHATATFPEQGVVQQAQWGHSLPATNSAGPIDLERSSGFSGPAIPSAYRQSVPQAVPGRNPGVNVPPPPSDIPPPRSTLEMNPAVSAPEQFIPMELQPYLASGARVLRIPIRLHPGEEALFGEPDIILYDGDILFIESRETEIYYTGGLLGGGQYQLPRDYDLDVLDAISIAQGGTQSANGGAGFGSRIGGIAAVNQDISVSASNLVVMRRCPDGSRINIKIDLNRALRDPNENLIIQPGDHLILRYKPMEAIGAFIERNLLAGSLIGIAAQNGTAN